MIKISDRNCTGIVKYVYDDISEETIDREIKNNYDGAKYELFKKDNEFTGMIKVTFKDEATLNRVVQNKFSLGHCKYITEVFKHKGHQMQHMSAFWARKQTLQS